MIKRNNPLTNVLVATAISTVPILIASSAQAAVIFNGTIGQWISAGSIEAGDKRFTFGSTDLSPQSTLQIETADEDDLNYLLNVNLVAQQISTSSFFLDYTVEVTDPLSTIVRVNLDSTVSVFDPVETLETTYNNTVLTSVEGSSEITPLVPQATFIDVGNIYTASSGSEITSFQNSFQQQVIPEPMTILSSTIIGGVLLPLKRKLSKNAKN